MPDISQPRALIWDMGGVLVRNMEPSIRNNLAAPYNLTGMDLENLFFGSEIAQRAALGQAHEADMWEHVRQKLGIDPQKMPEFIAAFWRSDRLDEELHQFTASLKPRYRVGLLSNAFPETRASLRQRFPHFYDPFDLAIFSCEVQMAKPDPRIYRLALEQLGVAPSEAVFVDDFIENVEGAGAVGIHAIHFQAARQVLAELKELFP